MPKYFLLGDSWYDDEFVKMLLVMVTGGSSFQKSYSKFNTTAVDHKKNVRKRFVVNFLYEFFKQSLDLRNKDVKEEDISLLVQDERRKIRKLWFWVRLFRYFWFWKFGDESQVVVTEMGDRDFQQVVGQEWGNMKQFRREIVHHHKCSVYGCGGGKMQGNKLCLYEMCNGDGIRLLKSFVCAAYHTRRTNKPCLNTVPGRKKRQFCNKHWDQRLLCRHLTRRGGKYI